MFNLVKFYYFRRKICIYKKFIVSLQPKWKSDTLRVRKRIESIINLPNEQKTTQARKDLQFHVDPAHY